MTYFVHCHVERIEEYRRFATDLIQLLRTTGTSAPELKPFLESLEQTVQQIPQEYSVQKENMKSAAHAADLQPVLKAPAAVEQQATGYVEVYSGWASTRSS